MALAFTLYLIIPCIHFLTRVFVTLVALPFPLKKYLKAKERIMKTQIFHPAKIDLIFKKSSKKKQKSFKIL